MCQHVYMTSRNGTEMQFMLDDCTPLEDGEVACRLGDKQLAHLMASGQFKKITVQDVEEIPAEATSEDLKGREVTYKEDDFPAFIAKVLGASAVPPKVRPLTRSQAVKAAELVS